MAVVIGVAVMAGRAQTELHTYGHIDNGDLHCTLVADHWPGIDEFHACSQTCQYSATVTVLD